MLDNCGVHGVFRLHQRRPVDFRTGWRLGADDHIVVWKRPPRPEWMSQTDYDNETSRKPGRLWCNPGTSTGE